MLQHDVRLMQDPHALRTSSCAVPSVADIGRPRHREDAAMGQRQMPLRATPARRIAQRRGRAYSAARAWSMRRPAGR